MEKKKKSPIVKRTHHKAKVKLIPTQINCVCFWFGPNFSERRAKNLTRKMPIINWATDSHFSSPCVCHGICVHWNGARSAQKTVFLSNVGSTNESNTDKEREHKAQTCISIRDLGTNTCAQMQKRHQQIRLLQVVPSFSFASSFSSTPFYCRSCSHFLTHSITRSLAHSHSPFVLRFLRFKSTYAHVDGWCFVHLLHTSTHHRIKRNINSFSTFNKTI